MKRQGKKSTFEKGDYRSIVTFLRQNGYKTKSKLLNSRNKNFTAAQKSAITAMLKTYARREKSYILVEKNGERKIAKNEKYTYEEGRIFEEVGRGTISQWKNILDNSAYVEMFRKGGIYQFSYEVSYYHPLWIGGKTMRKIRTMAELEKFIYELVEEKQKNLKGDDYETVKVKKIVKGKGKKKKTIIKSEKVVPQFVLSVITEE